MKRNFVILVLISVFFSGSIIAQTKTLLKATEKSYSAAEKSLKKGNYKEATESYEIVMKNIPINVESKKYLKMRIETNIQLIDIYFNHSEDLRKGCIYVNTYYKDMAKITKSPYLKSKDIFRYQELQKDYEKYQRQCKNFKGINSDKKKFEKTHKKEFKKKEIKKNQ